MRTKYGYLKDNELAQQAQFALDKGLVDEYRALLQEMIYRHSALKGGSPYSNPL